MFRRFTIGALVAALVSMLAVFAAPTATATATADECPTVAYFAVGGTGDTGSRGVPHVPAGWRMNIEYPANVLKGDHSRNVAREKLNREARAMRATCPGTRIEVFGYSLGASAGSLVVDDWQADPVMNQNTAATFYGNPRHPVGPDGWGGIEAARLPNIPFGVYTWHGARRSGPIPVTDICNWREDFTCSSPTPLIRDLIGAWGALDGYLNGRHAY